MFHQMIIQITLHAALEAKATSLIKTVLKMSVKIGQKIQMYLNCLKKPKIHLNSLKTHQDRSLQNVLLDH